LMVGLVLLLTLGPWLEDAGTLAHAIIYMLALAGFAAAIQAVGGGRRYAIAFVLLGSVTAALGMLAVTIGSPTWTASALVFYLVFATFTLIRVLRYVVARGAITIDKIYGALSVYLLAGFTWGGLYSLVELVHPESFQWAHPAHHDPKTLLHSFVYLSFVTLASLGYGDILPVTPQAPSLAMLDVIFANFYTVVIIARLVSGFEFGPAAEQ